MVLVKLKGVVCWMNKKGSCIFVWEDITEIFFIEHQGETIKGKKVFFSSLGFGEDEKHYGREKNKFCAFLTEKFGEKSTEIMSITLLCYDIKVLFF